MVDVTVREYERGDGVRVEPCLVHVLHDGPGSLSRPAVDHDDALLAHDGIDGRIGGIAQIGASHLIDALGHRFEFSHDAPPFSERPGFHLVSSRPYPT